MSDSARTKLTTVPFTNLRAIPKHNHFRTSTTGQTISNASRRWPYGARGFLGWTDRRSAHPSDPRSYPRGSTHPAPQPPTQTLQPAHHQTIIATSWNGGTYSMTTPEQRARKTVDQRLNTAGWHIQDTPT